MPTIAKVSAYLARVATAQDPAFDEVRTPERYARMLVIAEMFIIDLIKRLPAKEKQEIMEIMK